MKRLVIMWGLTLAMPLWSALASAQDSTTPATEKASNDEESAEKSAASQAQRLPSTEPRVQIPADTTAHIKTLGDALAKADKNIHWLTPDDPSFLTLWQADRSGAGKGAVLILHGEGEHAHWPETIQPLHDTLPDYGWATLAISLPQAIISKPPRRTLPVKVAPQKSADTEEDKPETDSTETTANDAEKIDVKTSPPTTITAAEIEATKADIAANNAALAKTIEQRLSAALQFLHDRGQFNIVFVSNSSNAIHAHQFISRLTPKLTDPGLKKQLEKPVRAMVIVNAHNRLASMQEDYREWFNDPELIVLDILASQQQRHYHDSQKRKVLAKQKKVVTYKHVKLPPLSVASWGENVLSRRIRSFLDANVQGVQVDRATIKRY